jgi:hypothetical protein
MNEKKRNPFKLRDFLGVDPEVVARLAACGIKNTDQMLAAGRTARRRAALASDTGLPAGTLLELTLLSDLARLPGVKGIRARLYYDAGVTSVEKMALWEPEALLRLAAGFVERTQFPGIPPLPREVSSTIKNARNLPRVIED